jgi:hypothetical protein
MIARVQAAQKSQGEEVQFGGGKRYVTVESWEVVLG